VWVLPFYGELQNRLFRDEIFFVAWPLYVKTRKGPVVTENFPFPILHRRVGPGLFGWQVWPVVGHERKVPTTRTNTWGDAELIPGHKSWFALWPIFLDQRTGLGGTNAMHQQAMLPLYSFLRSPARDSTSIPWLLGVTVIHDRVKNYKETGAPWPLIVFRRGEQTHIDRVWPFYSRGTNQHLESTWYLWPVYKYNRFHTESVDRERTRLLLFVYSNIREENLETRAHRRRLDLWPLFVKRRDWNGDERLQILAPIEPILPNNKSIERNYSPLWSVWRSARNARTGETSQSLLWNLYRRETAPMRSNISALFGLVQREARHGEARWRFFWWPQREREVAVSESR
jgi:hypothetical protein